MVLLLDNYDSFTYNLVQCIEAMGHSCKVIRNDAATIGDLDAMQPSHLIVSPGPSDPQHAGISMLAIRHFAQSIPVLGVCLGHQAIAEAYGGKIVRTDKMMHGKASEIHHDGLSVYAGLPNPLRAARYHSLIVDEASLPDDFIVTSRTAEGEIMGIRHKTLPLEGVQFHPESFLTKEGPEMIKNFLEQVSTMSV